MQEFKCEIAYHKIIVLCAEIPHFSATFTGIFFFKNLLFYLCEKKNTSVTSAKQYYLHFPTELLALSR